VIKIAIKFQHVLDARQGNVQALFVTIVSIIYAAIVQWLTNTCTALKGIVSSNYHSRLMRRMMGVIANVWNIVRNRYGSSV